MTTEAAPLPTTFLSNEPTLTVPNGMDASVALTPTLSSRLGAPIIIGVSIGAVVLVIILGVLFHKFVWKRRVANARNRAKQLIMNQTQ